MPCAKNQMPKRLLSILERFLTQTVFRIHFTHNNDNNAVPFFFYAQILSTLFTLSVSIFLPPSLSVTNSSMINSVQPWMGTHYASIKLMNQTHLFLLLWIVYTSWQPNTNNSFSAQNTHRDTHMNPSLYTRYAKMIEMMNVTEMSMLLNTQNVLINFEKKSMNPNCWFFIFFVFE